ncbi:homologous recombination OB-fold protein [Salvia divinorum]|uniref:Homologous recombination OB-fold protein n=1 Tax=Salvia divinorum TaxID=28513 RepID=A0ABD1I4E9_SALDI
MESEPWDALDLDDSDLPSLLRPCKLQRSVFPSSSPVAAETPSLQPTSEQPPPTTSLRHRSIPGPAGAVHAAMLRKYHDSKKHNSSDHDKGNDDLLSTQDYIRKALDNTPEFDNDFSRHPWLSALQFVGAEDGLIPTTPISSIKKCLNGDKVVQVVAIVKSCTPSGLGGLLVSLKDPTGTVDATIHHKVLSQSEFGKELTTGAVLILQKKLYQVAIFAPVRTARYLNVTMRNLVKVFCQNKESTSELYKSVQPVQYADPDTEYNRKARAVEMSSMQNEVQEDTEMRQSKRAENSQNENVIRKQDGSSQSNNWYSSNVSATQRGGYINLSQHVCNEGPEDMSRTGIAGDDQEIVNGTKRGAKGGNSEGNDIDKMICPLAETTGENGRGANEVQMQMQPLMSTATPPQWTDEQLDELFADDEDDASLF